MCAERIHQEICYHKIKYPLAGHIDFQDLEFNADVNRLKEFCELLIKYPPFGSKQYWLSNAIVNPLMTKDILALVKASGCKKLIFGIESGSQRVLDMFGKKYKVQDAKRIIKDAYDVGLKVTTNFMFGFPGETEEDFEVLEKAVKELKFDRLGCFTYSKEDGTPAAKFEAQIKANVKKQRRNKIMTAQNKIAKESLESRVGKTYEVLIEDVTDDELYFVGRSYMDSPDTDGVIFVARTEEDLIDKFVNVKIVAVDEYDLIGEVQKNKKEQ
jgi:tRNA A37 methylthiotransferase MiaB